MATNKQLDELQLLAQLHDGRAMLLEKRLSAVVECLETAKRRVQNFTKWTNEHITHAGIDNALKIAKGESDAS